MMHGKRKPGRGKGKPAARSGCSLFGCLLSLVLWPILIPLVVLLWLVTVFTGGLAKAAFTKPKGED